MAEKIIRTPKGVANWPFLTKPYTQFKPEGEYKVTLVMKEDGDGVAEFIKKCDAATKQIKAKNSPYTYDRDSGTYSMKLSSSFKPSLFDSHGVRIADDIHIGSGSVIICAVEPKPYEGFGGGIKFYLKAVQILEYVEYSGATADDFGFSAEEEGFSVGSFGDGNLGAASPITDTDGGAENEAGFDW
jgi:hypothetical protein